MSAIVRAVASSDAEQEAWRLRCDLAAVVASRLGWNEQIGTHHALMLPRDRLPEGARRRWRGT